MSGLDRYLDALEQTAGDLMVLTEMEDDDESRLAMLRRYFEVELAEASTIALALASYPDEQRRWQTIAVVLTELLDDLDAVEPD